MADTDAIDIGDRVVTAGDERPDLYAVVAGTRSRVGPLRRHGGERTTTAYGACRGALRRICHRPRGNAQGACGGRRLGGSATATARYAARSGQSVVGLERFDLGGNRRGASPNHSRINRHSYHTE